MDPYLVLSSRKGGVAFTSSPFHLELPTAPFLRAPQSPRAGFGEMQEAAEGEKRRQTSFMQIVNSVSFTEGRLESKHLSLAEPGTVPLRALDQ